MEYKNMETVKQIDDIVSSMLEWVSILTDELISESEKISKRRTVIVFRT